ncbi:MULTISPECIES: hypothetical protein [Rhizobium]|uniref:hypothetical protein n=1 Tax=Rhizobium TaxID=379 RepID=UPI001032054E|nr:MULTISPECIES: hypothetical protein [Rhizobium]MBY3489401.1 hypothetical protein [Rhizobium laguerreae]TBF45282.1 hypothetical protein ELG87_34805 [Rhizobium leguminosarum]TBG99167.1 hypothetical protein ELG68_29385 [Rhizobium leguminosarum]
MAVYSSPSGFSPVVAGDQRGIWVARRSKFQERLYALDMPYRTKKRTRADDLRDFISETAEARGFEDLRGKLKRYMITFDKKKNSNFDYWFFDEILVQICHGVGGNGIEKPMHQLRIMEYRKDARHLLATIRYYCRHYPNLDLQRVLVMVVDDSQGYRLARGIYRS